MSTCTHVGQNLRTSARFWMAKLIGLTQKGIYRISLSTIHLSKKKDLKYIYIYLKSRTKSPKSTVVSPNISNNWTIIEPYKQKNDENIGDFHDFLVENTF